MIEGCGMRGQRHPLARALENAKAEKGGMGIIGALSAWRKALVCPSRSHACSPRTHDQI